eukprot:scaffold72399_cov49-Cyclotella_meneghiniana.AAC.2
MTILSKSAVLAAASLLLSPSNAFAPPNTQLPRVIQSSSSRSPRSSSNFKTHHSMMPIISPEIITDTLSTTTISSFATPSTSSTLLSFSDQGQNLAGTFFQLSLLPYLAFLYFLSFRANRTPDLGQFGFGYLLLFVLGTIPSGIVTKSVYGETLANVDWLHGGAELLLTVTNVLIVSY